MRGSAANAKAIIGFALSRSTIKKKPVMAPVFFMRKVLTRSSSCLLPLAHKLAGRVSISLDRRIWPVYHARRRCQGVSCGMADLFFDLALAANSFCILRLT